MRKLNDNVCRSYLVLFFDMLLMFFFINYVLSAHCQSIEAICSMCTLYELGQAIAGIKNKKRFEELHLGPLCKIPLVHRLFTISSNTKDDDIYQIETVDLLRVRSLSCALFGIFFRFASVICVYFQPAEKTAFLFCLIFL